MSLVPPAPSGVTLSSAEPRPQRPEMLPLLGLAVVVGIGWWWDLGMPDPASILGALAEVAPIGILVVATTLLLAGGGIDLALGGIAVAAAMTAASLPALAGVAPGIGALAGLAMAVLLGCLDGAVITLTRRPAWLVTGTMLLAYAGLSAVVLGLPAMAGVPLARWAPLDLHSPPLTLGLSAEPLAIPALPLAFWCWLGLLALVPWLLHATAGGNRILALGASPVAAKFLGLGILRTRVGLFAAAGAVAGIAGLLQPAMHGPIQLLDQLATIGQALAAAVIGGAMGLRRRESFLGGALALLLLALVGHRLTVAGLPPGAVMLAFAVALLVALAWSARRRSITTEVI